MKKRWLLVVLAVMIAAVMGIAIACDDDKPEDTTYKVTYTVSSELGTVEITDKDGNAKTTFKSGEDVTVTVTPDEGYIVYGFKVNGVDAELVNGKHTFKITQDTTVLIEYDIATYTVSAACDSERGTVAIRDENGAIKTTFNHGDTVVIVPTAADGYTTVAVKVNGAAIELDSGEYTFIIKNNAEVEVAFGLPAITQAILDTSNANLHAAGTCVCSEEGRTPITYVKKTVYGTDAIYIEELLNGSVNFAEAYVNQGGKLALVTHTIHNEIETQLSPKGDDFAEYYNPFALLIPADFELTDKADVFKISDAEKARDAATAITGWNEGIDLFEVTVDGGKLTKAYIETKVMASGGTPYKSVYKFDFTEHGTAELDDGIITPFEHKAEHDLLSAALAEMANAESYTISYLDHEDGYVDIVYSIFVTDDLIYENCPNEENGYAKVGSKVYPFDYRKGNDPEITLFDPVRGITEVSQLKAGFIGNYAKELFELTEVGDDYKVFTLRYSCGDFAGDIFSEFGDGVDKMKYYGYALSGSITLDDNDKLLSVSFDCYVYGSYSTVTLTYNDINSTVIPEDFDFSNCVKVSKFDDYVGTYVDKYYGSDMYVVIDTEDGITIYNDGTGVIVEATGGTLTEYFVISYEDEILRLMKKSARQLIMFNDAYYYGNAGAVFYEFILESDDFVIAPAEYRGTWYGLHYGEMTFVSGDGEDEVAYDSSTYTITAALYYGDEYAGECYIVGSDAEVIDSVTFTFGDTENLVFTRKIAADESYAGEIIPTKYTGQFICVQENDDGITIEHDIYIYQDTVVIDSRYVEEVYVEITATTIDLDGDEAEILSYDATDGFVGYWNGTTLYFDIKDGALVIEMADGIFNIYDYCIFEEKEAYEGIVVPDKFIGKWEGDDNSLVTVTYTLVVTDRSITVQQTLNHYVEGEVYTATITEASAYTVKFTVTTYKEDGETVDEVYEYTLGEMYDNIYLVPEGESSIKLSKKQGGSGSEPNPGTVEIPEELFGTYMGSGYYVSIDADEVVVMTMSDSIEHEVVVTECEYYFGMWILNIRVDGVDYSFMQDYEDESGNTYIFASNDNDYSLTKVA